MMTEEELKKYVKRKLKKGYPEGELRNDLLAEGYTKEQIDKAVYDLPSDPELRKKYEDRQLGNNPLWFLASLVLIVGSLFLLFGTNSSELTGKLLLGGGTVTLAAKLFLYFQSKYRE